MLTMKIFDNQFAGREVFGDIYLVMDESSVGPTLNSLVGVDRTRKIKK